MTTATGDALLSPYRVLDLTEGCQEEKTAISPFCPCQNS